MAGAVVGRAATMGRDTREFMKFLLLRTAPPAWGIQVGSAGIGSAGVRAGRHALGGLAEIGDVEDN